MIFTFMMNNKKPSFKLLKALDLPNLDKITSAAVVAFDEDLNILTVNLKNRGIDLPGGHIDKKDLTIYDTVKREAREEAFVELADDLKILAVIESDCYDHPTYMVILMGKVKKLHSFTVNEETTSRKFMKPADFLQEYRHDKKLMKEILNRSISKINDKIRDNQN